MSDINLNRAIKFVLAIPFLLLIPGFALLLSRMWMTAALILFLTGTSVYLATISSPTLAPLYLLLAGSTHLAALFAILALKGDVRERG